MPQSTAAVLRATGAPLSVETIDVAPPRADEVRVKIVASGICHTDLGVMATAEEGQLPYVLGHEGAGVVEEVGPDVTGVTVGDRVVLSYAYCGECVRCEAGLYVHCRKLMELNFSGARGDGTTAYRSQGTPLRGHFFGQSSFSGQIVTSPRNLVRVDDDLPLELLAPLGCGVQTGAGAVLNSLDPAPGSSLAVFGAGSVGLSAVMAAKVAGCTTIVAVEPRPERRALALELGATHALDPAAADAAAEIVRLTGGGADHSVECIGLAGTLRQALECLASPGVCATVGFQGVDNELTIDQGHLLFGRSLVGVVEGDADAHEFIPRMIALHREGRFPFDRLITAFPVEKINEAIDAAHHGAVVKPVVTFPA
ncbi:NAD(P)-dependent alcohol dehydrogenase [Streptomyces sp. NPDC014733]|uniref:NAD(P)-dependent alcohol dehydrogenase n=1 Tax=Streptomyces sp. NPDC014733 TaxID=3364885 RepID=UPI0037025C06